MACEKGCTYTVHAHRDNPNDPAYPIVVCPFCMTRWFGHREGQDAKPLDPTLPDALRDAIILDQSERVFEILQDELGYTKTPRPNGIISAGTLVLINPGQTAQITARPQCDEFTPTHFVTGVTGFMIDDIRVGNVSMLVQSGAIPSEAFRVNMVAPDLVLRPGTTIGEVILEVVQANVEHMPPACSSFKWPRSKTPRDLVVTCTNASNELLTFASWFLGIQRSAVVREYER
jgi:hypothetical protein